MGIMLITSPFFKLVNGPSIAEESIPLMAINRLFTSSLLSFLGLFLIKKSSNWICFFCTLPNAWKKDWLTWLERDRVLDQQSGDITLIKLKFDIQTIDGKLNLLLDSYLDGTIDSQAYKDKKNQLFTEKKSLEDKIAKTKSGGSSWLEPMTEFVHCALQAQKVARPDTPSEDLRIFAKNIGSNYFLKDKQLTGELKKPFASLRAWAGARAISQKSGRNFFEVTPGGFGPPIFRMKT